MIYLIKVHCVHNCHLPGLLVEYVGGVGVVPIIQQETLSHYQDTW